MLKDFLPILVMALCAGGLALAILLASALLGPKKPSPPKLAPYECGVEPVRDARDRITVHFYLIAMLFILFDVETVFFYPWAVVFRQLKSFAVLEMAIFIAILLIGYVYVWRRGGLEWE